MGFNERCDEDGCGGQISGLPPRCVKCGMRTRQYGLYEVPAENIDALRARIAKLTKRAAQIAKRGCDLADVTPIQLNIGESFTKDVHHVNEGGRKYTVKKVYYLVTVEGSSPRVNGWEFIATLQHIEEVGTILRAVPTATLEADELRRYRYSPPVCNHCDTKRWRKDTFVVRNAEKVLKQVGRNCLADFLGHTSPDTYARYAEILLAIDEACSGSEEGGYGGGTRYKAPLEEFLGFVLASIRALGWMSRTKARELDRQGSATADCAWRVMFPFPGSRIDSNELPTESDVQKAITALAWVDDHLHENGTRMNDYEHNLSIIVQSGVVDARVAGIAASLIRYYEKERGIEAERLRKVGASNHFGTVGKRETFRLTLERVTDIDGNFGVTKIHNFHDADGNEAVWFSSSVRLDTGVTYDVKATVKEHNVRNGVKQTIITRCAATKVEEAA